MKQTQCAYMLTRGCACNGASCALWGSVSASQKSTKELLPCAIVAQEKAKEQANESAR